MTLGLSGGATETKVSMEFSRKTSSVSAVCFRNCKSADALEMIGIEKFLKHNVHKICEFPLIRNKLFPAET